MNTEKIEGKFDQVAGKIKQSVGEAVGNQKARQRRRRRADQRRCERDLGQRQRHSGCRARRQSVARADDKKQDLKVAPRKQLTTSAKRSPPPHKTSRIQSTKSSTTSSASIAADHARRDTLPKPAFNRRASFYRLIKTSAATNPKNTTEITPFKRKERRIHSPQIRSAK